MIPSSNLYNLKIEEVAKPSLTYKLEGTGSRINGMTDGLDAIKQAVGLILSTERYVYPVYSWRYGIETDSLIGKPYEFVSAEIKGRIREALLQDDRIIGISGFEFTRQGDEIIVEFEVQSEYGNFDTKKVVNI